MNERYTPKIIRKSYPLEINIFILSIIFILACFFSHEMFEAHLHDQNDDTNVYWGMFLVGLAVILMVLILWEDILFHVRVKIVEGGLVFRNHQTKLVTQVLIYCVIPVILSVIYFQYDVKIFHFIVWAVICLVPPIAEKIVSGINNYHDFLKLTDKNIEYKNNKLVGNFELKSIQNIAIIEDERKIIHKIQLFFKNENHVIIDLDEMELDEFYDSIKKFIITNYIDLLKTN